MRSPRPMKLPILVVSSICKYTFLPSNRSTTRLSRSMYNTSPLMVLIPCRVSASHFIRLGNSPFLSAQGSRFIPACVTLDRLKHSTKLHDMTPMIFGMDPMGASSVKASLLLTMQRTQPHRLNEVEVPVRLQFVVRHIVSLSTRKADAIFFCDHFFIASSVSFGRPTGIKKRS